MQRVSDEQHRSSDPRAIEGRNLVHATPREMRVDAENCIKTSKKAFLFNTFELESSCSQSQFVTISAKSLWGMDLWELWSCCLTLRRTSNCLTGWSICCSTAKKPMPVRLMLPALLFAGLSAHSESLTAKMLERWRRLSSIRLPPHKNHLQLLYRLSLREFQASTLLMECGQCGASGKPLSDLTSPVQQSLHR